MPELPEVETVRRGLDAYVVGRRITSAEFHGARVVRRHLPGAADLAARVEGSRVVRARRRGKYLWLVLEAPDGHDQGLLMHLGMSGQLLVQPPDAPDEKHLHARFGFADGQTELRFVDQRTFGGVALAELDDDGIPEPIAHIAPDPLEAAWDEPAVVARMKARGSGVKRCLLDQSLVSGIGNIYADEALWRAAIHGERPANRLTKPALHRLLGHAARRHGGGARPGRDELRRALRQRQRLVGLLRPVPGRLRAGGPAVPPLRDADPARGVHEPLVVLLPALPAAAPGHDAHDTLTTRSGPPARR